MKPLAYHLTWHTHMTHLPGSEKGWVRRGGGGIRPPDERIKLQAELASDAEPVVLTSEQRAAVAEQIRETCAIRGWTIHALNVRTTHVHVVVTADAAPERVMEQLKAWASRRLNRLTGGKGHWWVYHGSTKWINDPGYLQNAITYVTELQ
ncbi:MAG TPA: transposase [Gemmataceae bacterium]|nr:transposase [Gemmataceae bacterium]